MPQKTIVKLSLCVISAFALLSCAHMDHAKATAPTPAPSVSIADDEIRDVVNRVARHQIHPLKDGEYPPVQGANAVQAAQAAAKPDGIAWGYPWGVALYGLTRSTDADGVDEPAA